MPAKSKNPKKQLFDDLFRDAPADFIDKFVAHLHLPYPDGEILRQVYIRPKTMTNDYFARQVIHKDPTHFYDMQNKAINTAYPRAMREIYNACVPHIKHRKP